jgi:DNA-binding response OmpR family regulator
MKRILICEDEKFIREFVVINLRRAGYEVVDTDCGEAALEAYARENGAFDIAVLDIMMPGIDGISVCRQLRAQSGQLGIILLTAKAQDTDREEGLASGADDYITKPFSPSELVKRVDKLCRRLQSHS